MKKKVVFVWGVLTGSLLTLALVPQIEKIRHKKTERIIHQSKNSRVLDDKSSHMSSEELQMELEKISQRVDELMN